MSAHRIKPTITPERVDWFAEYFGRHSAWGEFHVCLSDGNWWCTAGSFEPGTPRSIEERAAWPADLREHAEWFDMLTESQRRRLGPKAERRAMDLGLVPKPWRPPPGTPPLDVIEIDEENGTITLS
jgi:hypothetical protein